MVQAVLMWVGAVLAIGLLLVMALGPVIVELDAWWYGRRRNRGAARARTDAAQAQRPVPHPVG
jgi:hypothetical protein